MPISAQVLRICSVACVVSLGLLAVRGLPNVSASDASSSGDPGACRAPETPSLVEAAQGVRWITQDEAKALVGEGGVLFVDCRPRAQFEAGHVTGAVHFAPSPFATEEALSEAALTPLRAARTLITYCDAQAHCARSFQLAQRLLKAGLPDVRVLEDGLPMWLERGYPAESGACQQCESH